MLPQPGGVSHVQQTKTGWKHFCVGLLSLATVQPLHPPLPKSVPPQMIDYSTALPETPDTYFTLSYRDEHYNLRRRSNHNLQLPIRTTTLNDRNFMRALYKDMNYSQASSQH